MENLASCKGETPCTRRKPREPTSLEPLVQTILHRSSTTADSPGLKDCRQASRQLQENLLPWELF